MKIRLVILFASLSFLSFAQSKKTIKNFVESFIIYKTENKNFYKNKGDVLIVGIYPDEKFKDKNVLTIHFDSSCLLKDFPYKKVYSVSDFKLIVFENKYSYKFNNIFKEVSYEDFNLGNGKINYNYKPWSFTYNKKDEITSIYGFLTDEEYKFLLKRKFKFSNEFEIENYLLK